MLKTVDVEYTLRQYAEVINTTKETFLEKNNQYGQSWIIARPFSMLEQMWIKVVRIRTIQEKKGEQKVEDEPIDQDFYHIINYCILGLILINKKPTKALSPKELERFYEEAVNTGIELCKKKNHDYGEAWRELAISTMIDLMLMKYIRARTMHYNKTDSEKALCEIFLDIFNYAVFCRIKIDEGENPLI